MRVPARRRRPRTRIHTPQPRPARNRRVQHRPTTKTDELLKYPPRTHPTWPLVIASFTAVIPALENATTREVALMEVALVVILEVGVEVGVDGFASLGGLGRGGTLEGRK